MEDVCEIEDSSSNSLISKFWISFLTTNFLSGFNLLRNGTRDLAKCMSSSISDSCLSPDDPFSINIESFLFSSSSIFSSKSDNLSAFFFLLLSKPCRELDRWTRGSNISEFWDSKPLLPVRNFTVPWICDSRAMSMTSGEQRDVKGEFSVTGKSSSFTISCGLHSVSSAFTKLLSSKQSSIFFCTMVSFRNKSISKYIHFPL